MTLLFDLPSQKFHGMPLWAFVLLMLLAVGAWSAWNVYTDYHNVLGQEYRLLEVRARQREARISGALQGANLMLGNIIDDRHDHTSMTLAERNQLMRDALRQLPELHNMLVTDAKGRVLSSSNERLVGFDASGREYFKVHRDAPSVDVFHVSRPFKTFTGITASTLSRVIRDSHGRFAGVIVTALEPAFFDEALKLSVYEPGVQSVLINRQGDILNAVPPTDIIGKNLQGGIAYTEHLGSGKTTTHHLNRDKLVPVMRMAVFHNLPGAPLTVIVSRDYDSLMAEWRLSVYVHLASYILLSLVTLLLVAQVARRQKSLVRAQLELAELHTLLQEQVIRDPLTGLHNRRYLDETLPRELSRAKREGYSLALIMLDLDHFKRVNDTYGHATGDEVLKTLSSILTKGARESDIICRYGGEEFLVALPRMSAEQGLQRVETWRLELANTPVSFGDSMITVTLSAGIAGFPDHGADVDTLLLHSDEALYRSKNEGRNRVTCFETTE